MTRPLSEYRSPTPGVDSPALANALQHSGRAFAAAVSALMVAALVVGRTEVALRPAGVGTEAAVTSGVVSLRDDDQGSALFDLENLTPSEKVSRCITVIYDGTVLPADLSFIGEVEGELAPFLNTEITSGTSGGFDDCSTFVPDSLVFDGVLSELPSDEPRKVWEFFNTGESVTFRVDLQLADQGEAMGQSAGLALRWEATSR